MNCDSSTSHWKPWRWVRVNLIFTIRDICINSKLNLFTGKSRSMLLKISILPWNNSQIITKTVPINTRIVTGYAMKRGIPFFVWWNVNGNWDNHMIQISQWKESHCRTNTSVRKLIQKSRAVRVIVKNPTRKTKHLSKVIWDRNIIAEFTWSISSTRVG